MLIPITKQVISHCANGELEINKIGDSYHLTYHNAIYKGSPFKVPTSFSTSFTINKIVNSSEIKNFLSRFN